jgi:putative membrane protein
MASDRTLMAWTRTALAQLSFSFTIVKVLEGFQERGQPAHPHAPQVAGLVLAALGMLSLALGGIQYILTTHQLLQTELFPLFLRTPAIMASLMFLIGLVLFIGIAVRFV